MLVLLILKNVVYQIKVHMYKYRNFICQLNPNFDIWNKISFAKILLQCIEKIKSSKQGRTLIQVNQILPTLIIFQ